MTSEYAVSDDDIILLQKQINIDEINAKTILEKNKGDLFESTMDAIKLLDSDYKVDLNENKLVLGSDTADIENETNPKKKLEKFRHILDEKDAIFQEKVASKIDISDTSIFNYITFTYNTTCFVKDKINSTRDNMLRNTTRTYLTDEISKLEDVIQFELELSNPDSLKLVNKYLGKDSKRMYKKWGLNKPGMFYLINQIVDYNNLNEDELKRTTKYKNNIATKFLIKSEYIKENQMLVGPCVVIDEWF